jgi:hypothetical protein
MTKEYQKGNQKFLAMHIEAKKNGLTTRANLCMRLQIEYLHDYLIGKFSMDNTAYCIKL